MKESMKKRLIYFVLFLVFFCIEVIIAIFVDDKFIRPFGGDIIVMWVVYCFARVIIPNKLNCLPFLVLIFAVLVEVSQYFNLVELLGLSGNRLAATVMGSSFSFIDIACYVAGYLVIEIVLIVKHRINKNKIKS